MKRINVGFYDEIYERLGTRTKNRMAGSIAQSIRELVDLGLKVEDAANREQPENEDSNSLDFLNNMLKNNIRWTLESLLISRQLVGQINENNNIGNDDILKKCKEQALAHVKKLFPEDGETEN